MILRPLLLLLLSILFWNCRPSGSDQTDPGQSKTVRFPSGMSDKLGDYWYQGEAELNRYSLEQNRYDTLHPGEVILVFVTEDFRTDKQVKDEGASSGNSVSVLKNIRHRNFSTGLYDYHLMTTVFTPVTGETSQTMKVSASTLDWCGQTYMQLNLEDDAYAVEQFSYFEREGDRDFELPARVLEDELWNRIRIDPNTLPSGRFEMIPAATHVRLQHLPCKPVRAEGKLETYQGDDFVGDQLRVYTVRMPDLQRELQIVFSAQKPYPILGWTDTYPSVFDGVLRTTMARRTHHMKDAYWEKNDPEDQSLRTQLGR